MSTRLNLEAMFTYHQPRAGQVERYQAVRECALQFAALIAELCPESAEQTLAIRAVHEASMLANAAIAINEAPPSS
jgi:hypothetical protein